MNRIEPVLLLFRRDLRLTDHPALDAAVATGAPVIPVYVWDEPAAAADLGGSAWGVGAAQKWWIHHSLSALRDGLRAVGSDLVLRVGATSTQVAELTKATGAASVYWSRRYDPHAVEDDRSLAAQLEADGISTHSFAGVLMHNPDNLRTGGGKPYRVFTPFYRKFLDIVDIGSVLPAPGAITSPETWPSPVSLSDLNLLPEINWANGFHETGEPGEAAALRQLEMFCDSGSNPCVANYDSTRDEVAIDGTSRLSPRLAVGELSPRQVENYLKRHD